MERNEAQFLVVAQVLARLAVPRTVFGPERFHAEGSQSLIVVERFDLAKTFGLVRHVSKMGVADARPDVQAVHHHPGHFGAGQILIGPAGPPPAACPITVQHGSSRMAANATCVADIAVGTSNPSTSLGRMERYGT